RRTRCAEPGRINPDSVGPCEYRLRRSVREQGLRMRIDQNHAFAQAIEGRETAMPECVQLRHLQRYPRRPLEMRNQLPEQFRRSRAEGISTLRRSETNHSCASRVAKQCKHCTVVEILRTHPVVIELGARQPILRYDVAIGSDCACRLLRDGSP